MSGIADQCFVDWRCWCARVNARLIVTFGDRCCGTGGALGGEVCRAG